MFPHFSITPKVSPEGSSGGENSQASFCKPLPSGKIETAITDIAKCVMANSENSLANNAHGTTFAARARAAELQAVRSRKVIKDDKSIAERTRTLTSHEEMNFTKPQPAGMATGWKTVHPVGPQVMPITEGLTSQHFPCDSTSLTYRSVKTINPKDDLNYHQMSTGHSLQTVQQPSRHPQDAINAFDQEYEQSPNSKQLAQRVANYDISQWDLELPAENRELSRLPEIPEGSNQTTVVSVAPSTGLIPILSLLDQNSDQMDQQAEYLGQLQDKQLNTLMLAKTQPLLDASRQLTDMQSLVGIKLQQSRMLAQQKFIQDMPLANTGLSSPEDETTYSAATMSSSQSMKTDDDPFTDSPSPKSLTPQLFSVKAGKGNELHYGYSSSTSAQFAAPRYPAVKGTMHSCDHFSLNPSISHKDTPRQIQLPKEVSSTRYPQGQTTPDFGNPPYRKLSSEEKKGILLQQLNAVAESGNVTNFNRTVLHDPFAQGTKESSHCKDVPSKSETGLIMASEPLPWKDRPVNVVSTPSVTSIGHTGQYRLMLLHDDYPHDRKLTSQEEWRVYRQKNLEDAESWWRNDDYASSVTQSSVLDGLKGNTNQTDHDDHSSKATEYSFSSSVNCTSYACEIESL